PAEDGVLGSTRALVPRAAAHAGTRGVARSELARHRLVQPTLSAASPRRARIRRPRLQLAHLVAGDVRCVHASGDGIGCRDLGVAIACRDRRVMTLRILHVLDHSIPLHSGYTFRTLSILREQRRLGWETFHITSPKHSPAHVDEEEVDGWH